MLYTFGTNVRKQNWEKEDSGEGWVAYFIISPLDYKSFKDF